MYVCIYIRYSARRSLFGAPIAIWRADRDSARRSRFGTPIAIQHTEWTFSNLACIWVVQMCLRLNMHLLYSSYECTYGGYYGLVVVTPRPPPPPRPQTFHRSHDNLKNPYRIASIFYMYIDIGERMPGKQDGPGPIIYGPPRPPPPPKSPKCAFVCIRPTSRCNCTAAATA